MYRKYFPHAMVYLGFLTTGVFVPKEAFFVHRFAYVVVASLLVYFFFLNRLFLHKHIVLALLVFLVFSALSVFQGNADPYLVFRSFTGLVAMQMALFSYFRYYKHDYKLVFRHYVIISLILSYIGIFQEISYLLGFKAGYDYSWLLIGFRGHSMEDIIGGGPVMRIYSLYTEPGYLATTLMPAGFLAIRNVVEGTDLYINRKEGAIILVALLLTFSSIGYVGILISILFTINRKMSRRSIWVLVAFMAFFGFIVVNFSYFQSRAQGIWNSIINTEGSTGRENVSSLVVAVNYNIAKDNFMKHPLIGSGYDSYQIVSRRSLNSIQLSEGLWSFIDYMDERDMMYDDGSTMYFRIITEMGLLGLIFVIWFLYNNKVNNKDTDRHLLQNMCLVYFAVYCFRTGQYIRFELWYFVGLYYCIKRYREHSKCGLDDTVIA